MSRSRKKTPITGITTAKSEKQDKRNNNRKFRRVNRIKIRKELEPLLINEISNPWAMEKDGKYWFGDDDPEDVIKMRRK